MKLIRHFRARSPKVWPPLINSHSFMQTLTNQKPRTVSSWLLIGLNLCERMWLKIRSGHTCGLLAVMYGGDGSKFVPSDQLTNDCGTIGSLLNDDDDDGNENGKKELVLDKQNNNFARASRFFCTFLCRRCTTTTWNFLISRFVEDGEQKTTTFFFFSWTLMQSFRFQLQTRTKRGGIRAIKLRQRKFTF